MGTIKLECKTALEYVIAFAIALNSVLWLCLGVVCGYNVTVTIKEKK